MHMFLIYLFVKCKFQMFKRMFGSGSGGGSRSRGGGSGNSSRGHGSGYADDSRDRGNDTCIYLLQFKVNI